MGQPLPTPAAPRPWWGGGLTLLLDLSSLTQELEVPPLEVPPLCGWASSLWGSHPDHSWGSPCWGAPCGDSRRPPFHPKGARPSAPQPLHPCPPPHLQVSTYHLLHPLGTPVGPSLLDVAGGLLSHRQHAEGMLGSPSANQARCVGGLP